MVYFLDGKLEHVLYSKRKIKRKRQFEETREKWESCWSVVQEQQQSPGRGKGLETIVKELIDEGIRVK